MSRLIAKAGTAIVKPYEKYSDRDGLIYIPQIAKYVSGRTGKVVNYTPYPEHHPFMVYDSTGRKVAKEAWRMNHSFIGLTDKHVLFRTGIRVNWQGQDYIVVRLEHILAVSDEKLSGSENFDTGLVERCQFCKSSNGEGNIILDSSGYCPQCGLNARGLVREQIKSASDVKVSDDEVYKMGGGELKDRRKKQMGIADNEQIISYSGQKRRSRNKTVSQK